MLLCCSGQHRGIGTLDVIARHRLNGVSLFSAFHKDVPDKWFMMGWLLVYCAHEPFGETMHRLCMYASACALLLASYRIQEQAVESYTGYLDETSLIYLFTVSLY